MDELFAELAILKEIDHPNVMRIYELFRDEVNYYLIMELMIGGEMFERIKAKTSFSEREAAQYMKQILSAIVYCHDHQIVHRDLKPENILLSDSSENATIKVIDFGESLFTTV